jgi:predicted nucleotidyltransferase component of viral defense system
VIPTLPDSRDLSDACRAVAAREGVQPGAVEKDFYLTRLLWALAQERGDQVLLKGGTCLSKCDLGYHRLSEDVDLIVPVERTRYRSINVAAIQPVRLALLKVAPLVGLELVNPNGEDSGQAGHVIWESTYRSEFGPQGIVVEVALGLTLRPPRRATLGQLLTGPQAAGYEKAFCWTLDLAELCAEKVRAAFTRQQPEPRDFYDLRLLLERGVDLSSEAFIELVNAKLAELGRPPLAQHALPFGLDRRSRLALARDSARRLAAVVRVHEAPFDLNSTLRRFAKLWGRHEWLEVLD